MDTPEKLLRELALHLSADARIKGTNHFGVPIGSLLLSTDGGALWKRIIDVLGGEPDMIRDVVAPIMKEEMFRLAYERAISITPMIEVKGNNLEPQNQDKEYLDHSYSNNYTSGSGSDIDPYQYRSASPVSAYYAIFDLWFRFHYEIENQRSIYINVNDWVFKLTSDGVLYIEKGRSFRFYLK